MSDLQGTFHPLTPPQSPGPLGEPQDFGGGLFAFYYENEETLATGGATTTTSIVLPLGAVVAQVTARITTAIGGAPTNWAIGVTGATSKFITIQTTLTAGFTITNNKAFDPSGANALAGPVMDSARTLLITQTGPQASSGKIRIGVGGFYMKPFTS
jgi:hypothetical protein